MNDRRLLEEDSVDLLVEAKLAVRVVAPAVDLTVVAQGQRVLRPDHDVDDVNVFKNGNLKYLIVFILLLIVIIYDLDLVVFKTFQPYISRSVTNCALNKPKRLITTSKSINYTKKYKLEMQDKKK